MSERKKEIVELLKRKGIDPVRLERELVSLLRKGSSSVEVGSYLRRIIEGEKK